MPITTQTIRIDLNTGRTVPVAYAHQNDTARTLVFKMYNGGLPYTMTGHTVKFAYMSPLVNGQHTVIVGASMASGSVSGSEVTVTLPVEYTKVSGVGLLTMIITPTSGTIRPVNIKFVVMRSADGDDVIASASDFPTTLDEIAEEYIEYNLQNITFSLSSSGTLSIGYGGGSSPPEYLLDLNRPSSSVQSGYFDDTVYVNPSAYSGAGITGDACTVTNLSATSITVKCNTGARACAFPIKIADVSGKQMMLSMAVDDTTNMRLRLLAYNDTVFHGTDALTLTNGSLSIAVSSDNKSVVVGGTTLTCTSGTYSHIAVSFGAATSTTVAYTDVSLTEN